MRRLRVLINGFGRIGRAVTRINMENDCFELVAINDINPDNNNIAYLIKYDSTYGRLSNSISSDADNIYIDGKAIRVTHYSCIKDVDMQDIDLIVEASGVQSNIDFIEEVLSKQDDIRCIVTNINSPKAENVIFGVNDSVLDDTDIRFFSSSICDAISLGPIYNAIVNKYDVESGFLVTLHPWLSYQNLLDGPAKSWSQPGDVFSHYALGRNSTHSLIPKSTSAVRALDRVIDGAMDRLCSFSYRTPTQIVSSAVLTLVLNQKTTPEDLIGLFTEMEKNQRYHIIETTDEPLISTDYVKNDYSAIIDTRWIQVKNDNHMELVYWYDNEWGYSSRIVDMIGRLSEVV